MTAAWLQAAQAALASRDFATARRLAAKALQERPSDFAANQILGIVALERGDLEGAQRHFQRADASAPGQPLVLNMLGIVHSRAGKFAEARRLWTRAGERGLVDAWRNLGGLEASVGDVKAAARAYERALLLNENDPASHAGLGQALESQHDLARARAHAHRALSLDSANEIASLTLANLALRARNYADAEAFAARVVRKSQSKTNQAIAWGVIGDSCDHKGDAATAFAAFTEANRVLLGLHSADLGASHLPYHPDGVARMTAFVEREDFSAWCAPDRFGTPAPIFLVGFPRSGTTLLEQVLSAHSELVGIEEREHLALSAQEFAFDPSKLASLSGDQISAIRVEYWRRVRKETNVGKRTVVDKLPLNIIFLPLVRRIFPDAKVLLAVRDPRDVVLSCFQQRFGMNAAMVQFLDLATAASYYDKIMTLGFLARDRMSLDAHEVRYENVVADLEKVARGVTEFLGIEFEPDMLKFRERALERVINTPSARQVVEPIYSRSVGRWRKYDAQLAPVLPLLNAWAERLGYAG